VTGKREPPIRTILRQRPAQTRPPRSLDPMSGLPMKGRSHRTASPFRFIDFAPSKGGARRPSSPHTTWLRHPESRKISPLISQAPRKHAFATNMPSKIAAKCSRKASPLLEFQLASAAAQRPFTAPEKSHLSMIWGKSSLISSTYEKHVEYYFNY
jgi:hypothetical protein